MLSRWIAKEGAIRDSSSAGSNDSRAKRMPSASAESIGGVLHAARKGTVSLIFSVIMVGPRRGVLTLPKHGYSLNLRWVTGKGGCRNATHPWLVASS